MNEQQKRQRIETIAKITGLLVVSFLVAPIILTTIKGLIGLIVAGAFGFIGINMLPWFGYKVANWRLKALKHEASKNPIEVLENQYIEKEKGMFSFREDIRVFRAEISNFEAIIKEHKRDYPEDNAKFDEQYNKMVLLYQSRCDKYKQVQANLAEFTDLIKRKKSEWKVAEAAARMQKASGIGEDAISKIMADTAIETIQTSLNSAFAELEVSLLDEQGKKSHNNRVAAFPSTDSKSTTLDLNFEDVKLIS